MSSELKRNDRKLVQVAKCDITVYLDRGEQAKDGPNLAPRILDSKSKNNGAQETRTFPQRSLGLTIKYKQDPSTRVERGLSSSSSIVTVENCCLGFS